MRGHSNLNQCIMGMRRPLPVALFVHVLLIVAGFLPDILAVAAFALRNNESSQKKHARGVDSIIRCARLGASPWSPRASSQWAIRQATASSDYISTTSAALASQVLQGMQDCSGAARDYAASLGLASSDATLFALFSSIRRNVALGLQGHAFVMRNDQIKGLSGLFTMDDLEQALQDDFLDAARGSTDNRSGWKITDVSVPRGDSFEEARMTFADVLAALQKGTVIVNAAGAHIPQLAGPCLAATDATLLPCALNLYVTAPNLRTSAPPHTDKQDVAVVQSTGCKHWKVYSVPSDTARKWQANVFARGKGEDSLPLHLLESDLGCELLLETTLRPGDVLFVPAGFPHTTSTAVNDGDTTTTNTSVHLTIGMDHHIWELDYVSVRRLAMLRAKVADTALQSTRDAELRYIGEINKLSHELRAEIMAELPLGLLDDDSDATDALIEHVSNEVQRLAYQIDATTASAVDTAIWHATVGRVRQQGRELLQTHRDMYLAALQEGELRAAEAAMTAHLNDAGGSRRAMTPERMRRLSLFRVKRYFDDIDQSKRDLRDWSLAGATTATTLAASVGSSANTNAGVAPPTDDVTQLPPDWAFTMPVKVGDQVEADLGGAYFPATVAKVANDKYDVHFFDGDREINLTRAQIKLLHPPLTLPTDAATASPPGGAANMTAKQLKRWKKQQEKLQKKVAR